MKKVIHGFTLIEMAMVLVIVGLLIGGLLVQTSAEVNQQKIKVTEQRLEQIKEALLGFAVANLYLPCPDYTGDGKQDRANVSVCDRFDVADSYLPWADLGVERFDGWGRPFRYRVDGFFSNTPESHVHGISKRMRSTFSGEDLILTDRRGNKLNYQDSVKRSNIVAIIFSCGKNGRPDGGNANGTITTANCDNGTTDKVTYWQDMYVEGVFDDIVITLPKTILISRLISAGRWSNFPDS
jgi:prepilin-type N-terminal cleavage/methylation domain-containing protein